MHEWLFRPCEISTLAKASRKPTPTLATRLLAVRDAKIDGDVDVSIAVMTYSGSQILSGDACQWNEDSPMSFVEQARTSGLCRDYLTDRPFASYIPSPPETSVEDLADPPGVQDIAARGALDGTNFHEKWDVDKESAGFLASVLALAKDDETPLELQDSRVSFCDLKVIEPLLHCDPELELQQLRRRNQVKITSRGMPPAMLVNDDGEGIGWSLQELERPVEAEHQLASEKLDVSQDVSSYLRDIAGAGMLSHRKILAEVLGTDRVSSSLRSRRSRCLIIFSRHSERAQTRRH